MQGTSRQNEQPIKAWEEKSLSLTNYLDKKVDVLSMPTLNQNDSTGLEKYKTDVTYPSYSSNRQANL